MPCEGMLFFPPRQKIQIVQIIRKSASRGFLITLLKPKTLVISWMMSLNLKPEPNANTEKRRKKESRIGGEDAVMICDKILAGIPESDKV